MKSIRLSLILYFLLLLGAALWGVSWLSYQNTRAALRDKEESTAKLMAAQFQENCQRVRADFDQDLRIRARTLSTRAFAIHNQTESLLVLGALAPSVLFQGHLQIPIFAQQAFNPFFIYRIRQDHSTEVRLLPYGAEDANPMELTLDFMPLVEKGEYYQVNSWRGRILDHSPNLSERALPFDEEEMRGRAGKELADDVELSPGHKVRRVALRSFVSRTKTGLVIPGLEKGKKGNAGKAPKGGFGPGPRPVFVYLQFASETTTLDKQIEALRQSLSQNQDQLYEDTRVTLAGLRTRMLWVGLGTFAAVVFGGFLLVHLGLSPLQRLSEAVRRVSPQDFRLAIEAKELPTELQPIAGRLAEALEQLKRAFAREKQAAADMSHELRTPLAALLTNLDLALRKERSADEYRAILQECRESGAQMNQLVESLFAMARLDAGADQLRPRPVDVADIARSCATLVRPLAEARGLDLRVHTNGPLPMVTDPDKFREILTNLLHNAIEYNKPKGSIDVNVERINGAINLEVRDTGIGIPQEACDHLFERFFRVDPSRHSETPHAGLGLAIVKSYVELMGGTIGVQSDARGSTFRVCLPAH